MITPAQRRMIDNAPPELRGDMARDTIHSARIVVMKQIAEASRKHGQESQQVLDLTERRNMFDREFDLVIAGDKDAIKRALNEHLEFVREYYKETSPKGIIGLDGGPN